MDGPIDIKSGETQIMDFFGSYTLLSIFNRVYNSLIKKILPKADITHDGSKITEFFIKTFTSITQVILNLFIFIGMVYLLLYIFTHDMIANWWKIAPPAIYLLTRAAFLFYHIYNRSTMTSIEKTPFGLHMTQIILMISTIFITCATFMVYGSYTEYYDQYMNSHGNKPPELTGNYKLFFDNYNNSIGTYLLFSSILIPTTLFCYHYPSKSKVFYISTALATLSAIMLTYTTTAELGNSANYLNIIRQTIV
jgi:hypothetical protein